MASIRLTYDEAIKWLHSRGGTLARWDVGDALHVLASAEQISAAVTVTDSSNESEIRTAEVEAIRRLKSMLGS
jgi:hypothetical protein